MFFFLKVGFMEIKKLLNNWYRDNSRDLPWRSNKNPYPIWLSEIILQQTQVVQGLPYYKKFIENFPTVYDLASANEDKVLKLWQGLGYYSRARNLHFAAKQVVAEYSGHFPKTYKELLKLKGVGDYTASAIASIAYDETVPTIDGNVLRVISRLFDIDIPVDSNNGKKIIKGLMIEIMDVDNPGNFNQAVMELGALVCKPKKTDCDNCPLKEKCLSYERQNFLERPVKTKKIKVKDLYVDYLFLSNSQGVIMQQRNVKTIWKKLFEFPNVTSEVELVKVNHLEELRSNYSKNSSELFFITEMKHKLTHRNLYIRFFKSKIPESYSRITSWDELKRKAVPKPIEVFLRKFREV